MNDTSPDIERKRRELMMKFSAAERVKMTSDMFEAARTIVVSSFPPGTTSIEARLQLCKRLYSGEVDVTAFSNALGQSRTATE